MPANTCTTRPPVELPSSVSAAEPQLRDEPLEILDVVLDEVRALGTPARVAVAAHVEREHVVVAREVGRDVVEGVRVPRDAVQQDHRRLRGVAPFQIVKAQAVDRREAVGVGRLRRGRNRRRQDNQG